MTVQSRGGLYASDNHCFVCGPGNPIGPGVGFAIEDDVRAGDSEEVVAESTRSFMIEKPSQVWQKRGSSWLR